MPTNLPALLDSESRVALALADDEVRLLNQARRLFDGEFYGHALLDIWNAAVSNLRRRTEAYGIDLWESVVKEEAGRKKYDKSAETFAERWSGVDDLVLIGGAARLGILNKKAGKALEMINWMRNHASAAHNSDEQVQQEDIRGISLILYINLFAAEMPDPGHSVATLFTPLKTKKLQADKLNVFADQVRGLKAGDLRTAFGFLLDLLCKGELPGFENARELLPVAWEKAPDDLRKTAGARYHLLFIPADDSTPDKDAAARVLDFLTTVGGIRYIPEAARARIYRRAAQKLEGAKETSYGWPDEEKAALTLAQFGPWVPSFAFDEVYQEILAVYCGNYWGRSKAYLSLSVFFDTLTTAQLRRVASMFVENERVQEELAQSKPKAHAVKLLKTLKQKVTISTHKDEIEDAIKFIGTL